MGAGGPEERPFAGTSLLKPQECTVFMGREGTKRLWQADGTASVKRRDERGLVSWRTRGDSVLLEQRCRGRRKR